MRNNEFINTKRELFDKYYRFLNDKQREAVYTVEGPLLVLAGAGSGKTTVLVNRIAHILRFGNAYFDEYTPPNANAEVALMQSLLQNGSDADIAARLAAYADGRVYGSQILCITFTNKAAREFKERLEKLLGESAQDIWAGTFHATCAKILRIEAKNIGFSSNFTIYDTDDVKRLIKSIMSEKGIDEKAVPIKTIVNTISNAKENCLSPEEFAQIARDYRANHIARIYAEYQQRMEQASAMDFDDLILNTVMMFREHPPILEKYINKFRYILVDEFQDTNPMQNELVVMLGRHGNVAVVGDDDQSIYSFRGATVENILGFDKHFPNNKTIKLEQNYRSTSIILNAANAVIANNKGRKGKNLWTAGNEGKKIETSKHFGQVEEANYIVTRISELVDNGAKYSDFAVLYRVNAMANAIETAFAKSRIPYRVFGGVRFFDRKEIKDILAYLAVVANHFDNVRLRRIINVPKRQIGEATVDLVANIAAQSGVSMLEIIKNSANNSLLSRVSARLEDFYAIIADIQDAQATSTVSDLVKYAIFRSGYFDMLLQADEKERAELLTELVSVAVVYENNAESPSLAGFLEEVALVSDTDNYDKAADAVSLMTVHSAKGLEFPAVFIAGMEEGLFPSTMALTEGNLEEERRLAYVAITRAKRELFITHTQNRLLYGFTAAVQPSRFLTEIPDDLRVDKTVKWRTQENFAQQKRPTTDFFTPKQTQERTTFKVGERVNHKTFGDGKIIKTEVMGGDQLLTITFDSGDEKKLMASFAKLKYI